MLGGFDQVRWETHHSVLTFSPLHFDEVSNDNPTQVFVEVAVAGFGDFFDHSCADVLVAFNEACMQRKEVDSVVIVFNGDHGCGKFADYFPFEGQGQVIEARGFHFLLDYVRK